MIPINTTLRFQDILEKDNVIHNRLEFLPSDDEAPSPVSREQVPSELEYVFQVISEWFSYIMIDEGLFPSPEGFYWSHLQVFHIPFHDNDNPLENKNWNNLVSLVNKDFQSRLQQNEWNIDYKVLNELIIECWGEFEVVDRKRLDVRKLVNLALFAIDFCNLTLFRSKVHPSLFNYLQVPIKIGGKQYLTSKIVADSIKEYMKAPFSVVDNMKFINYQLTLVQYATYMANPQAEDKTSYITAMFTEIMHQFFMSFGLKKRAGSEWSSAETILIYELLRFFGICNSEKSGKDSTWVKTAMRDYKDYFDKCKLYTWLRYDQEYSYLMNKRAGEIFIKKEVYGE